MKAVLFAGASIEEYAFCQPYVAEADCIICCDSGLMHADAMGIHPDYLVGDFDSVPLDLLETYRKQNIPVRQYPAKKDETDVELGIFLAMELQATEITILGGIGSRFDHTLANAHLLLRLLRQGIVGRLVDANNCVMLMDSTLHLTGKKGDLVSTIPLTLEVTGLTLTGFAYPLFNKTLKLDDDMIAVSNVMLGESATIEIKSGYLFVIQAKD